MADDGFININLNDVDDGSAPVPEGPCLVRIKTAEKKHKTGSEYPYILVIMNPLDKPGFEKRNLRLTLSFHPEALWNMKRFCKAARIDFASGLHLEDFPGKELIVNVKIVDDKTDPEVKRNEVTTPYSKAA